MARSGIIYRIYSDIDDEDYIGSTWDTPKERLCCHISHYKKLVRENKPIAKSLIHFSNIGWDNVKIEILEQREFDDVDDRLFCEREWIEKINPTLNLMRRPRITEEERNEWHKQYNQRPEVRDRRQAYMKEYNAQYQSQHKERLQHQSKEYREKNKDKIKEHRSTKKYKNRKSELRKASVHHCDICNVDVKGDISAYQRHCLTKTHTDKLPNEAIDAEKQKKYYEMRKQRYKDDYAKRKPRNQVQVECHCCKVEFQKAYLTKHNRKPNHIINQTLYDFITS